MRFRTLPFRAMSAPLLGLALLTTACADSPVATAPSTDGLVVYGSGSAAGGGLALLREDGELQYGGAATLTLKLYALHISPNADCSNPVLVQDLGAAGAERDFMQHPVLFTGTPAVGTYQCILFTMSDVVRTQPVSSFGGCVAGQEYAGDIYREGENDWKDVLLQPIIGTGTDELPLDSHVTLVMTRDTAAAIARGFSPHQTLPLQASLLVPGQSTFVMDASQAVGTDGVQCGLMPPQVSFR